MKKYLLFLSVILSFICNAQNPADVAENFGAYTGFDDYVTVISIQSDGKILVGGWFSVFKGVGESRLIRLNADGTKDSSFITGIGFNGSVYSIVLQNDGKILVGGNFSQYNGVTENKIIRLNTDGSKDISFNTGTGFNSTPTTIALQADGKILLGGNFSKYNGVAGNTIIRLNTDGSKDISFNIGTGTSVGFDNAVNKISLQIDNKILVGGNFTSYQGITENGIIRLNTDGSKDTSFITGTGFGNNTSYFVNDLAIQNDGKILVGGSFITYNGVSQNNIIRLNTDGTKDINFITGTGFNVPADVSKISIQSDGKILIGGYFSSYQGVTENKIIRLNTDGSKDISFNTGTGFNSTPTTIALQADGKILLGGNFTSYQGVNEMYIIRLNVDGSKHISFNTGNGFIGIGIRTVALQNDGKILVGGNFNSYRGVTKNGICRLNSDGSIDTSFNSGTGFMEQSSNSIIFSIVIQNDGKILIGGSFNSYNGVSKGNIIRLNTDGSIDTSFNIGLGFDQLVSSMALQSDGKIIVGGGFTSYQGITENRIIRLNSDGSKDTSFNSGTGFNNIVYTIVVQNDGKIVAGGYYTSYNGITENRIIRLNVDGSKDTSFVTGAGFASVWVWTLALQNDGKIIVGGFFTSYQGGTNNHIIRLNTNGSKDTSFISGTGFNSNIDTVAIQNDGKILVGGRFSSYQGITENRIIRLNSDGSKDKGFNTGTGFNISNGNSSGNIIQPVRDIVIQNDGKILVGGDFYSYKDSNASNLLIKLYGNSVLETETFETSSLKLYPNPVVSVLNVKTDYYLTNQSYTINDGLGRVVLNGKLTEVKSIINVEQLSKGIYYLKIAGNSATKFIKE
jgi:uncharacterized delta-60 repeat protein